MPNNKEDNFLQTCQFPSNQTKELFVPAANGSLVGTLKTMCDVTDIFPIGTTNQICGFSMEHAECHYRLRAKNDHQEWPLCFQLVFLSVLLRFPGIAENSLHLVLQMKLCQITIWSSLLQFACLTINTTNTISLP